MDIQAYFTDLAALVPLIVLVSEFVVNKAKLSGSTAQLTSWVVAEVLTFGGFFLDFGFLANIDQIWLVAVYGLAAGLVSNGVFDIKVVKALLEFVKLRVPKQES